VLQQGFENNETTEVHVDVFIEVLKVCVNRHLLGVVFQRVVVVIDADAEEQRTQALHQPFILA